MSIQHLNMTDNNEDKILLFYSTRCNHCSAFIAEAKKIPDLSARINMVEIEKNQSNLPVWLKSVPAIQTPDGEIMGAELFNWLKKYQKKDMGPSPGLTGKGGFDTMPYTSLTNEHVHQNFTLIGQENGCTNVDESKIKDQTNVDVEKYKAARQADIRDLM